MTYDKAIFGDNQFLGVNHSSQKKATKLFDYYSDVNKIIETLGVAYESGVREFMFTTHGRYEPVFREIVSSNLFPEMNYTPCLPYAHKYWSKLSEQGAWKLIKDTVFRNSIIDVVPSSFALLFGNSRVIIKMLLEIETLMCKGLRIKGIFLQNLAFDFLLSMEMYRVIESFYDTVQNRLGRIPGFITMNHEKAVNVLCSEIGLVQPWICANYNISGFRMHASKEKCESSFASCRSNNIAMSVMNSGNYRPAQSLEYVISKMNEGHINSILFGSSNSRNIKSNVKSIYASY